MDDNRYENFLKEFGKQVRLVRKERGMSMEAVAYKAGIEYRQLGRIERGEVNTKYDPYFIIKNIRSFINRLKSVFYF